MILKSKKNYKLMKHKLEETIISYIDQNKSTLWQAFPDFIHEKKQKAFETFKQKGFPSLKDEKWRKTKLKAFLNQYFHPVIGELVSKQDYTGECLVPDLKTYNISIINGLFKSDKDLEVLPNGIIIGSIKAAANQYPELVEAYFDRLTHKQDNPLNDLNTALFTDGLFVYVPKNIKDFKLQITHKLDAKVDALINVRNLIIVEPNSQLDIIQCDDSNVHRSHFTTFVSEVFVKEHANVNWYKYQNINNVSALFSNAFYEVAESGQVYTNTFELNGKLLRNEQFADITGRDVKVDLYGLYLVDKKQQSDNVIFISHSAEGSYSNQKFKGILDDSGKGFFNGQILVKKDAQQTNAYQKNDNILLTDKARISSQPFLEIYADDVSCSHGSTTGQIDEEALFYIRQRGIAKRDAQLLQLYAFAGEIIDAITIPGLIEPTKDLIKKRLNGELDACEDCILQCAVKS